MVALLSFGTHSFHTDLFLFHRLFLLGDGYISRKRDVSLDEQNSRLDVVRVRELVEDGEVHEMVRGLEDFEIASERERVAGNVQDVSKGRDERDGVSIQSRSGRIDQNGVEIVEFQVDLSISESIEFAAGW